MPHATYYHTTMPSTTKTPPMAAPRVGTSVFILRHTPNDDPSTPNPEFIVGRRLGSHGANTYALPGGHIEPGESPEDCAVREVLEETGLHIHNVRFLTATNDVFVQEGKHYITMFMVAERVPDQDDGDVQPETLEPHKCAGWEWMGWEEMKQAAEGGSADKQMFLPMVNLLKQRPGVVPTLP